VILVVATVVAVAGCSSRSTPVPIVHRAPATYTNPVIATDFPDPSVVAAGPGYVAVSTGSAGSNLPMEVSTDLAHWRPGGDALPVVPPWAVASWKDVWAPDLEHVGDHWVLWFAALDAATGRRCIGWAASPRVTGPYRSTATAPAECQADLGGSIDPSVFTSTGGHRWLLWKNDGNCCQVLSRIWSEPLAGDGTTLVGAPTPILAYTGGWEEGATAGSSTIEKPAMVEKDGVYHLFFSGNGYGTAQYAVGHAVCSSPVGPCTPTSPYPVLSSFGTVAGPGGESILVDRSGHLWMAYAAWSSPRIGYAAGGARSFRIDRLSFVGELPVVVGPTTTPVPVG
jgi:beta-xylosidase